MNKLLSASFWIPLSRLTYSAYLVHLIVISVFFGSFETVIAYSDVHIVSIVFTFRISLFISVGSIMFICVFIVGVCVFVYVYCVGVLCVCVCRTWSSALKCDKNCSLSDFH